MKKLSLAVYAMVIILGLSSCQLVGDIFKAGVWVGVLIVLGVIGLIIYLVTRGSGKN